MPHPVPAANRASGVHIPLRLARRATRTSIPSPARIRMSCPASSASAGIAPGTRRGGLLCSSNEGHATKSLESNAPACAQRGLATMRSGTEIRSACADAPAAASASTADMRQKSRSKKSMGLQLRNRHRFIMDTRAIYHHFTHQSPGNNFHKKMINNPKRLDIRFVFIRPVHNASWKNIFLFYHL